MTVLVHPTVNAFNRELAEALNRAGRLAAFHTSVAFGRRTVNVSAARVKQHPWPELARLVAQRLGLRSLARSERSPISVEAVYQRLDEAVAKSIGGVTSFYGYEDGSLACFRAAKQCGIPRIYELPIAYFETARRLLSEEAKRLPEWVPTLGGLQDSEAKLARKAEELALANLVVCPSRFVQRSLPEGTPSIVAEFGSPSSSPVSDPRNGGPLRLLFAGAMTQRKGLADVFAALRTLKRRDIELVVMGTPLAPMEFYRRQCDFHFEPPRPHSQVLDLMSRCDALVLPSIVEGRALVQQEALSRGLPLIVTANAGGEDLIEEGETGWLVPIRDPHALAEIIGRLADQRGVLGDMRAAARRKAAQKTWAAYTRKIITAIDLLENGHA